MDLHEKVAVVTGGASGIGHALSVRLADLGVTAVAVVDLAENLPAVCDEANARLGGDAMLPFQGDVTDAAFRESVFADLEARFGAVQVCVPAAAIVRDGLAAKVKIDNDGHPRPDLYDEAAFRRTLETNLLAPVYWAMRTMASVGCDRTRRGLSAWRPEEPIGGAIVLIGSVSAAGNAGQVSYAAAKSGLTGASSTLAKEAIYHGMRCSLIHPGFTDTPMTGALDQRMLDEQILRQTRLGRLITPAEIVDAICFMLTNDAVNGALWADGGWHPQAK